MDSAILPSYPSIGIHSNHMDMTRFETKDDPGFVSVVGVLQRWVKELKSDPVSPGGAAPASEATRPAEGKPAGFNGNSFTGTIHYGNNIRSNVTYGGNQNISGVLCIGMPDEFSFLMFARFADNAC